MTLEVSKKETVDYMLVYLLATVSGMPFFDGDIPLLGVFGLTFLVFFLRREGFHRAFFYYLFAFISILLMHSLRFDFLPLNTYLGFLIKMITGYFVIAILKQDFTAKYINIIYFLAIVSFIFAIPLMLSTSFDTILNSIGISPPFSPSTRKSLILFQLNLDRAAGIFRNCGPFWEPAAYGGYLLLALMFNMAKTNTLNDRKNIVFIIALISTLSTTVFLLLAILVFFYIIVKQKLIVKLISVPVVLAMFGYAYFSLDFLNEKIEHQLQEGSLEAEMRQDPNMGHNRFSSAIADYEDFMKYPVFGRGLFELEFYDYRDTKTRHNGLTGFIAKFGLIGSLIYLLSILSAFRKLTYYSELNDFLGFVFFGIVLGMAISEDFFTKPFFLGLMFLHLFITNHSLQFQEEETKETYA